MAHLLRVSAEDWDRFRKIVRFLESGSHKRRGESATAALGRTARQELRNMEARGNAQATRLLEALEDMGAQSAVKAVLKEETGTISIGFNGSASLVRMPTFYGFRRHDPVTGERLKQSEMWRWFSYSWDDFEGLINTLRMQARVLDERVAGLETVLPLRTKYPDSRTPLEAIELEGLDPYAFEWAR